jgi:hypothetical protein
MRWTNRTSQCSVRRYAQTLLGPYQNDWDSWVCMAEFALNDAWNNSVENTPFMLNYVQHPNTPIVAELQSRNPAVSKFVGKWDEQLQRAKVCLQKAPNAILC